MSGCKELETPEKKLALPREAVRGLQEGHVKTGARDSLTSLLIMFDCLLAL